MEKIYDVIIIGAGPAGLSAGLYAGRAKLDTLILEKEKAGGQIVTTEEVENYPGGVEDPTGPKLVARMVEQADSFGVERKLDEIKEINLDEKIKVVKGEKGEYKAKAIVIATGAKPRLLGAPGEKELTGKGVSYCATCDAAFFEDFDVYVIGGGDTAVEESLFISKFARKVTIVHRRDELRAAKSIQEKVFNNDKVDVIWNTEVKEIKGDGIVESMVLRNRETGEEKEIVANEEDGTFGIFVMVGYLPQTELFKGIIDMDDRGYIIGDENMKTNVEGVFVAGDCRVKTLRQVVTATADGAISAIQAEKYIENNFEE
ncbi:thioredoxin-disulfide reductase [Clostridium sp. D2Q-11]|uniref:Thioredoxin reductase n=1 Tax=Anaeromonas frigoriresistens TaxID=2683708 RepID=A0A942URD0_9FIRM|nr:thioredoxin-disulfide reductase [Anaeromonas frigoriresistens]